MLFHRRLSPSFNNRSFTKERLLIENDELIFLAFLFYMVDRMHRSSRTNHQHLHSILPSHLFFIIFYLIYIIF